ncbi:MAG: Zn-dependent oligopeptidase [Verrucomicrobia bacterium]|nr:Zn-dependent oligopeptidase [Verrucomicrobiota bacterium]
MHPSLRKLSLTLGLALATAAVVRANTPATLADFQALAEKSNCTLVLPHYPVTPAELRAVADAAMKEADTALDALAAQDHAKLTFANTFAAYDAITAKVGEVSTVASTVAESSMDKAMRDTANDVGVKLEEWGVALDYREPLYRTLKAYADTKPTLDAEQQRLVDHQMRDYRRAGLSLAPAQRAEVERLRKELAAVSTEFAVNINEARAPLDFTKEELAGVPQSFLDSPGVKQPDGRYRVMANITWHAQVIGENADNADVRRKVLVARFHLAQEKNGPVLKKLVVLRADIAHLLGYSNWADYRTETRMAKTGATAVKFEEDLVAGLQPKFDAEMAELRDLKVKQTGDAQAKLELSDIPYYTNKLKKEKFAVDAEKLRVYFPYQKTLEGMFAIYQKIFGLKFTAIAPPYVWAPGVQLYVVQDSATGTPMGAFYLDMFPREGKFNHFACFTQKSGGLMADGRYDLPVAALLCNFPAPTADAPSLLKHGDVETLFHEFGHVMHHMMSRSRFVAQGSFAVPRDFVEAPSQMLESWVWDKTVLDTFAADYRDPSKKIPAETIASLIAARQATDGYFNRRQLAIGLLDLSLHTLTPEQARNIDVMGLTNDVTARVSVAPPAGTFWAAYIGHLAGYDAGYYGYLWAKVMAVDMASVFKAAPGGFLDETVGRRLRDEVYGKGNTRDVGDSVEAFLGRKRSMKPFLDYVGIK